MSDTLAAVQALVALGEVRISDHGYAELADDGIIAGDVLAGLGAAVVVEDYPHDPRGRSVLALQRGQYRPDPSRWSMDYMRRIR